MKLFEVVKRDTGTSIKRVTIKNILFESKFFRNGIITNFDRFTVLPRAAMSQSQ